MPMVRSRYPENWDSWIRPQILRRAGNCCEWCGVRNLAYGLRGEGGGCVEVNTAQARAGRVVPGPGERLIRIVLTIAHVDHEVTNNDMREFGGPAPARPGNLVALCQRCHLRHDAGQHAVNAARTRRRKGLGLQPELDFGQEDRANNGPAR
jgi:hypothetical protein